MIVATIIPPLSSFCDKNCNFMNAVQKLIIPKYLGLLVLKHLHKLLYFTIFRLIISFNTVYVSKLYLHLNHTPGLSLYDITSNIRNKRMCNVYCVTSVALYMLVIDNYWKPHDNFHSLVKMAPGPCDIY